MGYYTVTLDGSIIDVAKTPVPCCKWTGRMVELCSEEDSPQGYVSERTGLYYHPTGWPSFPAHISVEEVAMTEVSHTVYETEKERLDREQKTIEELSAAVNQHTTEINYNQSIVDYNIMMGNLEDPEDEEEE